MLPQELLKQIRRLQLRAGRLATEALQGSYASAFRGRGIEFDEVREYTPGDDIRTIDWNVTARMNMPFVKIYREEREMTILLVVDVSRSQFFGTSQKTKNEISAELAAVLAFLAIRSNDKVGLILFSDHVEAYYPPKKGRAHVWRIIRDVLSFEPKGRGTDTAAALNTVLSVMKRKATCFLISDFLGQSYESALAHVARRHELIPVMISDRREMELSPLGFVTLQDSESGERLTIDTSDSLVRARFHGFAAAERLKLKKLFQRLGLEHLELSSREEIGHVLVRFLETRRARSRRRS